MLRGQQIPAKEASAFAASLEFGDPQPGAQQSWAAPAPSTPATAKKLTARADKLTARAENLTAGADNLIVPIAVIQIRYRNDYIDSRDDGRR
jgi:hypothetical protein